MHVNGESWLGLFLFKGLVFNQFLDIKLTLAHWRDVARTGAREEKPTTDNLPSDTWETKSHGMCFTDDSCIDSEKFVLRKLKLPKMS